MRLVLEEPLDPARRPAVGGGAVGAADPVATCARHGRPIRYAYTERDQPLSAYQTVFALPSADGAGVGGDAERGPALHRARWWRSW